MLLPYGSQWHPSAAERGNRRALSSALQSRPDCIHVVWLAPDSIMEETKAANSAGDQPFSVESSV